MTTESKSLKSHSLIHVEPFGENEMDIVDYFTKSKIDYTICRDMYKPHKNTLVVYDLLRQIMADTNKKITTPIITLSPDPSISASTVGGTAEKFMVIISVKSIDCKAAKVPSTRILDNM